MSKRTKRLIRPHHKLGKIDLSQWQLAVIDSLQDRIGDAMLKGIGEAIEYLLKDDQTTISFPAEWSPDGDGRGGKAPRDPLTIHLNLATDNSEGAVYAFSLREALADHLDDSQDGFEVGLERIRDGLRDLADDIQRALEKKRTRA